MEVEVRREAGEIHPQFWENTVKEAFKNDPIRILVELIKNAADSYTRMKKRGEISPPFRIFIEINLLTKNPPQITVTDHAEGMDSNKLKEALKYGTQTSRGEDTEAITSAEKGIGLKDAMMALNENWLTSIKDGKINERKKYTNFETGIGKEDQNVTSEERLILKIPENGTRIKGFLPNYFKEKRFSTIKDRLENHFLLRKLIQNKDYEIILINSQNEESIKLKYKQPKIEKKIFEDDLKIKYNERIFNIYLILNKSEEELDQGKPYGHAGILFYYGEYSVLDLSLGRFDRDDSYAKIFGEAYMDVGSIIRDSKEIPLVDEKRRGLDKEHPFNIDLFKKIDEILSLIKEEGEESKYSLDDSTKKSILKELNKMSKELKGRGPPPELPIKPEAFSFYPTWVQIREYESKKVLLIINPSIIKENITFSITTTDRNITFKPESISIKKEENLGDLIAKQVELYSEKQKTIGEVIATLDQTKKAEKIGVEVIENPIFNPENGFAFIPDKTSIIDGGEKSVLLSVDKKVISKSTEIIFKSQDPILCPGKWLLPIKNNFDKYEQKNILKVDVPIKVKGTGNLGKKAIITANYEDKEAFLKVFVVSEPKISGLFRDIILSPKETKKISDFNEDEGIIEIYYKHPLIQKYMQKNYTSSRDFLVFIADVITREAVKTIVQTGVEENSSSFPIFDMSNKETEIAFYIMVEYFKQGPKMHELFTSLARTLKVK